MRIPRLYCKQPLGVNVPCKLVGERRHYLTRVLRFSVGDKVRLFNGDGEEHLYKIIDVDNRSVYLIYQGAVMFLPEPDYLIHLYLSVTKSQSMSFAVQKAVELGVYSIHPVITEYSNYSVEASNGKVGRWRDIVRSAAEQCGRIKLPVVHQAARIADAEIPTDTELIALIPGTPNHFISCLKETGRPALGLLIGPEGGFSEEDKTVFGRRGFISACIGTRILRTETAVAAALTISQTIKGDLSE